MNTIPLSYDSLRTLLQHLEANLRFRLVSQCPSLRNVEKKVPLYINSLDLNRNYECKVNEIKYELNIVQFSREGPTPKIILDKNKKCDSSQPDIDRFGFTRPSCRFVKTPGDIIINPLEENWNQWKDQDKAYDEEMRQANKDELKRFENQKKLWDEGRIFDVRDWSGGFDPSYRSHLQFLIDSKELDLLPYTCRDKNIDSPYDRYVELRRSQQNTKKNSLYDEIRPFETVKYTRKLYETMKYFMTRTLGGRGHSIHVKLLTVGACDQIIRLPDGVKFNVQKIFTMGNTINVFDALLPIIDENCNPWKHAQIGYHDLLDSDHFENADEITLEWFRMDYLDEIPRLTNKKVVFTLLHYFDEEGMCNFIQDWLDNGRKVGTCYIFAFDVEQYISNMLNVFEQMFQNEATRDIDEGLMILPMKNFCELHISYGEPTQDDYCEGYSTWIFKLEVVSSDMKNAGIVKRTK
ncbi:hypothetical protein CAEBREN_09309 [Caenorhabditis brenneri]|uniref:Uncharacterized protein n=1 Tax=Caenorhabditis brenneri TaxID=135651 RepID=G0NCY7_CAEBE|nr:hypothetical protein CAEBREN_09309 [Caenorhabditis brenneri]